LVVAGGLASFTGGVVVAVAELSCSLEAGLSSLTGWLLNFDSSLAMQTPVTLTENSPP
jgi:hypothetical protein